MMNKATYNIIWTQQDDAREAMVCRVNVPC